MKKNSIVAALMLLLLPPAMGCGICGGVASTGNYLGVLPQYQKHFIGVKYQYMSTTITHPPSIIPGQSGRLMKESRQTAELAGRWCPGKRLQVLASVPYQVVHSSENGYIAGLGDISFGAYYSAISGKKATKRGFYHLLQLGGGVKLPTGVSNNRPESAVYIPGFQLGTGSSDFNLGLVYSIRKKKIGLMIDGQYSINGTNNLGYHFGNKTSAACKVFYIAKGLRGTWFFQTGVGTEMALADYLDNNLQRYTGGNSIMPLVGVDYFRKSLAFGLHYRTPVYQNISDGYAEGNGRVLATVLMMF